MNLSVTKAIYTNGTVPGVPTTMWGQLDFKTCSSLVMARPPKNTPTWKE